MQPNRFDLADLRLFLLVVEHGSLTRGAQAAHLALASASERITGMESALGTRLLERTRRGVRLTAAGEAVTRHARAILGQVEQMRGELRGYATGLKGRLRLLSNTAALAGFLPERLAGFLAAHPDLSVDLDERTSTDIVHMVAHGRADLGIVADTADTGGLQTRLVARDQLAAVLHPDHSLARAPQAAFSELLDEPFVGLADAALETYLDRHAARLGRSLQYRVKLRSAADLGRMIAARVGIAILPEACSRELGRQALAVRPLSDAWATRQLYLCARDFDALPPHALAFAHDLARPAAGA